MDCPTMLIDNAVFSGMLISNVCRRLASESLVELVIEGH
jgi:hypothetical protein